MSYTYVVVYSNSIVFFLMLWPCMINSKAQDAESREYDMNSCMQCMHALTDGGTTISHDRTEVPPECPTWSKDFDRNGHGSGA